MALWGPENMCIKGARSLTPPHTHTHCTAILGNQVEFRFPYILHLEPLHVAPEKIFDDQTVGASVNIDQSHWVAIKYHGGIIWLLDSAKEPIARQLNELCTIQELYPDLPRCLFR